ncbi:LOW QUALITY PROTEIN: guanylyl cyclase-activating protein 3 [Myotis myotis]|uniref:LOW QUALITY PROTEIN: guanylyl cyclase-activating protein 3 n=1 Tax=Myotis myotis TaxID=51298 RepID=UPI00174DC110|nr:LOW QUALITY PROTEIN: guanylyl cyclase-activating protein 3 [Myotis myotis]
MGHSTSIAEGLTAIPAKETYVWYRKCMMEYPSGLQTLHEFKTLLGLQGLNQKANQHAHQVSNTFDMNKDSDAAVSPLFVKALCMSVVPRHEQEHVTDRFIDFLEFIAAVNLVVRGKMGQKLKRYFKLYDADGNGSIDKKELLNVFMTVQALNGQQTLSPEEFTNLVFHKIDINHDGKAATLLSLFSSKVGDGGGGTCHSDKSMNVLRDP